MNIFRRQIFSILGLLGIIICLPASAQEKISDGDKKAAQEWIKEMREGHLSGKARTIKRAREILLTACSSEKEAMDLHVEAMRSYFLNETSLILTSENILALRDDGSWDNGDRTSPNSAFSDWRKKNTGSNATLGFKKALRLQFKWLLLKLDMCEAELKKEKRDVRAGIMRVLDDYMAQVKDIDKGMGGASIALGPVEKYLKINELDSGRMPKSLADINSIYSNVLIPPHKENKDIDGLRKMWGKRIALEIAILKTVTADSPSAEKEKMELGHIYLLRQIEMECDCYRLGDEARSLSNIKKTMLKIKADDLRKKAGEILESLLNDGKGN